MTTQEEIEYDKGLRAMTDSELDEEIIKQEAIVRQNDLDWKGATAELIRRLLDRVAKLEDKVSRMSTRVYDHD